MFESNLNCMLANIHINEPVVKKAKKARFSDKLETVHIFIPEEPENEEDNSERTSVPDRIQSVSIPSNFDYTSLPSYTFKYLHMYRRVSDIVNLKPGHIFVYCNVRLVGTYHYDLFKTGRKFYSHFLKDRHSDDKILLNFNYTKKFPALDNVILLFGSIMHKEVRAGDKVALISYICVKFWKYVIDPGLVETELHAKAMSIPTDIYAQTQQYIRHDYIDANMSGLPDNGNGSLNVTEFPQDGFSDTMLIRQVELDEELYHEFERLMHMTLVVNYNDQHSSN